MRRFYLLLVLDTIQTQYGISGRRKFSLAYSLCFNQAISPSCLPLPNQVGCFPVLAWHFLAHALSGTMLANQWCLLRDPSFPGHASQRGCPGNFILTLLTLPVTAKRDPHYVRSEFCIWRILPYDFWLTSQHFLPVPSQVSIEIQVRQSGL